MHQPAPRTSSPSSSDMDARDDDGSVAHRLTSLVNRLASLLVNATASSFREHGLSILAARSLIGLLELGGEAPVGALADMTSIDQSTMSHMLKRLEASGLLVRVRQDHDNRVVVAKLTPHGRATAASCHDASLRHEEMLVGGLDPDDVAALKRSLTHAYENVRERQRLMGDAGRSRTRK